MGVVTELTNKYQKCIDACNKCAQACEECMTLCLRGNDVQSKVSSIALQIECAAICRQSSCFMSMDAQYAKNLCALCADICDKCATECGKHKDDHSTKCAAECKACATECRSMSQAQ
jgi:hypothetical protein